MSEKEMTEQGGQSEIKKEKKTEKPKKPGILSRIVRWLREMKQELKKVQWPSKKQVLNNTLIVIACVIMVGVFIWIFDFLASNIIQALVSLFH